MPDPLAVVTCVHDADVDALIAELWGLDAATPLGWDVEYEGPVLPNGDLDFVATRVVGFAVSAGLEDARAWYVPCRHRGDVNAREPAWRRLLEAIVALVGAGRRVWIWGGQAELQSLHLEGIDYGASSDAWHDGEVAWWLAGWGSQPGLKETAQEAFPALGHLPTFRQIARGRLAGDIPVSELGPYCARDAWLGACCGEYAFAELRRWDPSGGLLRHYRELDMPCVEILRAMRHTGFAVDVGALEALRAELEAETAELRAAFYEATSTALQLPFEVREPVGTYKNGKPKYRKVTRELWDVRGADVSKDRQVAYWCYEVLKVWPTSGMRRTATGAFPVNHETLEKFLPLGGRAAELVELRFAFNLRQKLLSTYVIPLLAFARSTADGRVHGRQALTGTETQRFSHSGPNFGNLPSRSAEGIRVRKAIIAGLGRVLIVCDANQAELRIMAHMARDPELELVYALGEDVHAGTLAELQRYWPEAKRVHAKTTNFSVLYRITPPRLAVKAKTSETNAGLMIQAFHARFRRVEPFHAACFRYVETHGYMRTIDGFRRRLSPRVVRDGETGEYGLHWSVKNQACNVPIQGSVAGLVKAVIIHIYRLWNSKGWTAKGLARLLITEHDSVVADADPSVAAEAAADLRWAFEHLWRCKLRVAMVADVKTGGNWGECK